MVLMIHADLLHRRWIYAIRFTAAVEMTSKEILFKTRFHARQQEQHLKEQRKYRQTNFPTGAIRLLVIYIFKTILSIPRLKTIN